LRDILADDFIPIKPLVKKTLAMMATPRYAMDCSGG
jgi:hypothetical protein